MRLIQALLITIGVICLGIYGFITVQAWRQQAELQSELQKQLVLPPKTTVKVKPKLGEGDLVGRLEIPRLNVSVMVMEGTSDRTLRLGAGHIMGTSYPGTPGNSALAAHRDTFFRDIRNIKAQDMVRFTTPHGTIAYRVSSTNVVDPKDVEVLSPTTDETLTLVTCFPFYYIGPAPKRFIVHATRDNAAAAANLLDQ